MEVVGKVMKPFDEDNMIPVFGFGDSTTTDRSVFPFFPDRPARGFEEALARYKELTPRVVMSGPTNFAPIIEAAIQIVQETKVRAAAPCQQSIEIALARTVIPRHRLATPGPAPLATRCLCRRTTSFSSSRTGR